MNVAWPDILIAGMLLMAALKGFKRGFVSEVSGAIALLLSLIAPWFYTGSFDPLLAGALHVGPGAARVIAMFLVGVTTYAAVSIAGRVLNTVAKLPVLGLGNALAGAATGLLKAVILLWLLLYVALFFPLSPDLRADLHRSTPVELITQPDGRIDNAIIRTLPMFARPFASPIFARHKV